MRKRGVPFGSLSIGTRFTIPEPSNVKGTSPIFKKTKIILENEEGGPEAGMYNCIDSGTKKRLWFPNPIECFPITEK
jgi:hypothetical protein